MRKSLIAVIAAGAAVACPSAAFAQTPPAPKLSAKVSPSKAGTAKKPRPSKVSLKIENNVESKTTMSRLQIDLARTVRMSGRGLIRCSKTVLENQGPSACPSAARVGSGVAHALVGPHSPNPTTLTLNVQAFVGGNNLVLFRVEGQEIPVVGLLDGVISRKGRRLTLSIPQNLKQPAPGVFSALVDLQATLERRRGKRALFVTTGCKNRRHTTKATLTYEPNPVPPAQTTASTTARSRCSK